MVFVSRYFSTTKKNSLCAFYSVLCYLFRNYSMIFGKKYFYFKKNHRLLLINIDLFTVNLHKIIDPETQVLIEGVLFRAKYLGSTQLISDGNPTKLTRMLQAQEAVGRIKVSGRAVLYTI